MKQIRTFIVVVSLSVPGLPAIAQGSAQPTGTAGYTPPPVSTTYRPLTGKLFFTDAERDRLDKARKDGVLVVDGEVVARSPQVEGFVLSSGGRTTYWVDGGQRIDAKSTSGLTAAPKMIGPEPSVKFRESGVGPTAPVMSKSVSAKKPKPLQPNSAAQKQP